MKTLSRPVLVLALLATLLAPVAPASAATSIIYVNDDATGANNGASWTDAYTDLQSALTAANPAAGDTVQIWVAAGTYKPTTGTDREVSFALKNAVEIYGGFAGTETSFPATRVATNTSTLSGDVTSDGICAGSNDSRHVVAAGSAVNDTAILDGFTITCGNNLGLGNTGGGINNTGGSPRLTNLVITGNKAYYGAGLFTNGGNPMLTNVTFSANTEAWQGGGIYAIGSGFLHLSNVAFRGNQAVTSAAGMGLYGGSAELTNVVFSGNVTDNGAGGGTVGGLAIASSYSSMTYLNNVTISGNYARSANYGAGLAIASPIAMQNSIVWNNAAASGPSNMGIGSGTPLSTIYFSDLEGGCTSGSTVNCTDILNTDPQFVTPVTPSQTSSTGGDLRLSAGSPLIDAGSNGFVSGGVTTDLAGLPRIWDGDDDGTPTVDMGAYEYQSDSDGDGVVDSLDLPGLHVSSVQVTAKKAGSRWTFTGVATIVDGQGQPIAKAAVGGEWFRDGVSEAQPAASTSRTGQAKFSYQTSRNSEYKLCVTGVTKAGWDYWPGANVETCDSVIVP